MKSCKIIPLWNGMLLVAYVSPLQFGITLDYHSFLFFFILGLSTRCCRQSSMPSAVLKKIQIGWKGLELRSHLIKQSYAIGHHLVSQNEKGKNGTQLYHFTPQLFHSSSPTLFGSGQSNRHPFEFRRREEVTAGWDCNHCWTDPDIRHRMEVCWMWERTLSFNPKALSPSHSLLYVLGKCCMGLTSRQQKAPLRPALPPPAHSTHLGRSTAIMRRTQTSW